MALQEVGWIIIIIIIIIIIVQLVTVTVHMVIGYAS